MTIRPAYGSWPDYNWNLVRVVATLTPDQLAIQPTPHRWPLWATIGHLACQRVSWLCGFAAEPDAESTPFPDALHYCPGDEDLEHFLDASQLVEALDSTFRIVERCLDTWTPDELQEVLRRPSGEDKQRYTRGAVVQRVFAHDVYHIAELNEALSRAHLPQIDLWR